MERKLEQLDEHIDDASKKAEARRPQGDPADGDPVDDVAGGGTDNEDEADDPEGRSSARNDSRDGRTAGRARRAR